MRELSLKEQIHVSGGSPTVWWNDGPPPGTPANGSNGTLVTGSPLPSGSGIISYGGGVGGGANNGSYATGFTPPFMLIYNAIKYAQWTPSEIAQDIYTAPSFTGTLTEAEAMAADLVAVEAGASAVAGYAAGTMIYNELPVSWQNAIGGSIDSVVIDIHEAWGDFQKNGH